MDVNQDILPRTENGQVTMTEAEQEQWFNSQPLDVQAYLFLKAALPDFIHNFSQLSKKQMIRVMTSIFQSGLTDEDPSVNISDVPAVNAYNIGLHIFEAKHVLYESGKKAKTTSEAASAPEETSINEGETQNG